MCHKSPERVLDIMSWTDLEFPANYSSLQQPGCDVETIIWKRASDLCLDACLRDKCISPPTQGQLGDCWLVVAFHALSKCDDAWKRVFKSNGNCLDSGKVVVNLFVNGLWEPITIDDFLPVYKTQECWKLLNARNVEESQFWASLLEKACAKRFGCYNNLTSGQTSEGFLLLTGGYTWTERLPSELPCKVYDSLQCKIIHLLKSNTVDSVFLNCQVVGSDVETDDAEWHCYSFVLSGEENTLELWDPLSQQTSPLSDKISTVQQSMPVVTPTVTFATTSLGRIFESTRCEWTEKLIDGQWKLASSGGSIINSSYCNNPQYSVCIESSTDILVSHVTLIQPSKRNFTERKDLLQSIGIHVYRINQEPDSKLTERQLKGLECVTCLRPPYQHCQDVSLYVCQKCTGQSFSRFLVVPSTFMKNAYSKYRMRIVCNARLKVVLL